MKTSQSIKGIASILLAVFGFFVSIHLLGLSFQSIGNGFSQIFDMAFANPAIGLFIGLLGTAILQSSSTTTSMAVAAVAAGSVSLENAIPVVMGANIGTTLTSTIVSMSYMTKTGEFRKAVSAGTVHDIFNVLTCILLFPLELRYGLLSRLSTSIATVVHTPKAVDTLPNQLSIYHWLDIGGNQLIKWFGPVVLLIASVVLLFYIVKKISNILYDKLIGNAQSRFESIAFQNTFKSFGWGFLLTSVIQSSSLTTSLIVPLAATGKVKLKRAFQFIMGANLGTTITALLAALFKSEAAISLAIAHFLFNSIGVLIFLTIPFFGRIPLYLSDKLGAISLKYKVTAFAYILVVFFLLPFTLIYFSKSGNMASYEHKQPSIELTSNK
ncbi:MAG: Na/Pi symporter [Marinoscillum sp.]|uniref:Na/Pi symporter n=1 Tax=Marinoscillum sp. TaxID=2024838 RepID=UPI0032FE3207